MKKNFFYTAAVIAAVFLFSLFAGGCTELERKGYSAIPQNTPGAWEYNPYGM